MKFPLNDWNQKLTHNEGSLLGPLYVRCGKATQVWTDGFCELWESTVNLHRGGSFLHCGKVLFLEHPTDSGKPEDRQISIFGIDSIPNYNDGSILFGCVERQRAVQQIGVINMLRLETETDNQRLGAMSKMFFGSEFSTEGKVTAAYMEHRTLLNANLAVAYVDDSQEVQRICLPLAESGFSWLAESEAKPTDSPPVVKSKRGSRSKNNGSLRLVSSKP